MPTGATAAITFHPWRFAAYNGHVDTVGAPARHGVDVNTAGTNRLTALHDAAGANSMAAICLLLEAGADKDALGPTRYTPDQDALDSTRRTPLHHAAPLYQATPLHHAIVEGHLGATQALLGAGANATLPFSKKLLTPME